MPTIYTDGRSETITDEEARALRLMVEPHPGVGEDGIEPGDLRLNRITDWRDVDGLLAELRQRRSDAARLLAMQQGSVPRDITD